MGRALMLVVVTVVVPVIALRGIAAAERACPAMQERGSASVFYWNLIDAGLFEDL